MQIAIDTKVKNNLNTNKKKRESNFELLRIVSMLCIIAHHYTVHGGSLFLEDGPNIGSSEFLYLGGKLGVDCFILISAYFMVNSKFKLKKLLKIVFQVLFYMIVTMMIFQTFNFFNVKDVEDINVFEDYWFIKAYVGLYVVSPFLNDLIRKLTKERYLKLIIVLTLLQGFLPTFFEDSLFTNYITWFIYVYFIGGYIRLHLKDRFDNRKILMFLFCIGYLIILIPSIIYIVTGKSASYLLEITQNLASTYSLAILFCAVVLFLLFRNINIGSNKLINIVSGSTFGVYLIHDNSFISSVLWGGIIKASDFYYSSMSVFIVDAVVSVGCIFIVCSIIDLIRMYTIEKYVFKINFFDKYFNKFDGWINN